MKYELRRIEYIAKLIIVSGINLYIKNAELQVFSS